MFKRYALFLILALFLCGCGENGSKSVFESDNGGKYGKTWTVIGTYNGDFESFCGPRGEFQPGVGKYAVRCFVYDMHSKKLLSPLDPFKGSKRELLNGYLPAAKVVWENGGVSFECVNFVPHDKNVCLSRVVIKNTAKTVRKLRMSEACVPNMVTGGYADNKSLSLRGRNTVLCDGKPFLVCDEKFDCGGVCSSKDADTDITSYLIAGKLPRTKKSSGKCGNTYSSAVCYNLKLKPGASKTFCFASGSAVSPKTFGSELKRFSNFWEKTLKNVRISLPDKRAENCWYANLAYMLIMCDNGVSKPGAVAYDAFWVRDFAYFADTFFFADKYDFVKSGIEYLKTLHLSNGGFAHKSGVHSDYEYDACGEALYVFAQDYRRRGDISQLRADRKYVEGACDYLIKKCSENKDGNPLTDGILPHSASAEDLGSPANHHLWDDFWAVRGLRDGAYIENELGDVSRSKIYANAAETLLKNTLAVVDAVMQRKHINYIPNGAEDVKTSAMARGTSCALWPCGVLNTSDKLTRISFDVYWQKWFRGGGYVHRGNFWPYSGLDMAQCYLMLDEYDRAEKILEWSLANDSSQGFWSYPEGMRVADNTLAEGDMPHGWYSSAYISYLRNIIVRENKDRLMLFSGVTADWMRGGVGIESAPTLFGKITCRASLKGNILSVKVSLEGGNKNNFDGYEIVLPENMGGDVRKINGKFVIGKNNMSRKIILPADTSSADIIVGGMHNTE